VTARLPCSSAPAGAASTTHEDAGADDFRWQSPLPADVQPLPRSKKEAPVVAENTLRVYDGYWTCPLTVERAKIVLAEFGYGGKVLPTFPFLDGKAGLASPLPCGAHSSPPITSERLREFAERKLRRRWHVRRLARSKPRLY
jgi:hypothetical protein